MKVWKSTMIPKMFKLVKKIKKTADFYWNQRFWSEWWDSNSRPDAPKAPVLSAELHPVISKHYSTDYGLRQKIMSRYYCGQNFQKSRFGNKNQPCIHCAAMVSGFLLKTYRRTYSWSQTRCATNCATPGYTIKPHYIISFWGDFVKVFNCGQISGQTTPEAELEDNSNLQTLALQGFQAF